ncbi:MAG: flagellar hook assembly protein FlgD [Gammaproteobacteria bacterium]|nr:flagellar hook assembly protein FlgD [Gammaproteobacteria bacterium]MBU1415430.1 flagellar hook assembly protein FlgD [Gammaproteobacteria bacterium]
MSTSIASSTNDYYQSLIDSVNSQSGTSASSKVMSETENRFLKLLTTQLKNQDPLNPLDNAEVTSQLAQISTVSGIEKLNATLQTLLAGAVDSQTTQAASLVGNAVMVPGNSLVLSSSAGVGGLVLDSDADNVTVTISDENGLVMRTMELGALDAGLHNIAWDGATDSGEVAVDGNYSISVAATLDGDKVTATPLNLGVVRSVITGTSGYLLDLGSLGLFTMDDVKQIL